MKQTQRNALINKLFRQGHTYKELAWWFGISKTRVAQLCTVAFTALCLLSTAACAQQGPPSVTATWNAVTVPTPAALTYKLQRATVQAGPYITIGSPVTVLTLTDLTVTRGQTYFYQVLSSCPTTGAGCGTTATPINGDSGASNIVTAVIPNATSTPPIPTNLTLTNVQ